MKGKLILKHRGDYDYFLVSRTDNSEALVASLNPDEEIFEQKLSKQNCDEIFGVVDVDKLAEDFAKNHSIYPTAQDDTEYGFKQGFKKAMELNKDKVFTLEDMKRTFKVGFSNGFASDIISTHKLPEEKEKLFNEFIQSLQQPTEIEVEIITVPALSNNGNAYYGEIPKLDSEGCLILKKI